MDCPSPRRHPKASRVAEGEAGVAKADLRRLADCPLAARALTSVRGAAVTPQWIARLADGRARDRVGVQSTGRDPPLDAQSPRAAEPGAGAARARPKTPAGSASQKRGARGRPAGDAAPHTAQACRA